MKLFKCVLFQLIVLSAFLPGCVIHAPNNYAGSEQNVNITENDNRSFKIFANKGWQQPGIYLVKGAKLKLRANGSWTSWPGKWACDPGGDSSLPSSYSEVSYIPHCALMAKLGHNGKPFYVGHELELTAEQAGQVFFAINDLFIYLGDNQGQVSVYATVTYPQTSNTPAKDQRNAVAKQTSEDKNQAKPNSGLSLNNKSTTISSFEPGERPRVALVVGNSRYQQAPLINPKHDAQDISKALDQLGFDVITAMDVDQRHFDQAIKKFGRRLQPGGVALFYYAGHALQVAGQNYMVPIKSGIERQSDVRYKAVNVGQVLGEMELAENSLNIVVMDACRDNPLPRSFRSGQRGLARMDGPKGTIIAYATSPGSVASDGAGRNGVYTKYLLKYMNQSGLSVEEVFKKVLQGVDKETDGHQIPWLSSSFTGDFYFNP